MVEVWTIQIDSSGMNYSIVNQEGVIVGRYATDQCARTHHAMALEENAKLRKALGFCVHVIEKGIAVRMMDQWPALRELLPDAIKKANEALGHRN